jgi:hypothetical protein
MVQISGSVGVGGQNRREDVLVVQALINNKLPFPLKPLDVDGVCGDLTKFAITEYQRRNLSGLGMTRPDGRVDPGGATFRSLSNGTNIGPAPTPPSPPAPVPPDNTPHVPASDVSRPPKMRELAWRYLLAFTRNHEGAVFHMYNNRVASSSKQDVTCGVGFLIDPRSAATQHWLKVMFRDKFTKQPPTDTQMLADWDAAATLARTGNNLSQYKAICQLEMIRERVYEQMALILRDQKLPALLNHPACGPSYSNFESFPAAAQVFSLSFAYGRIPIDFPKMNAAVKGGRWAEAADQCRVTGMSEAKNKAHRELLLFAQNVVDRNGNFDELPANVL